ncbi:MAG: hypothetical protein R3F61_35385 [Myxococcota bacterium]
MSRFSVAALVFAAACTPDVAAPFRVNDVYDAECPTALAVGDEVDWTFTADGREIDVISGDDTWTVVCATELDDGTFVCEPRTLSDGSTEVWLVAHSDDFARMNTLVQHYRPGELEQGALPACEWGFQAKAPMELDEDAVDTAAVVAANIAGGPPVWFVTLLASGGGSSAIAYSG